MLASLLLLSVTVKIRRLKKTGYSDYIDCYAAHIILVILIILICPQRTKASRISPFRMCLPEISHPSVLTTVVPLLKRNNEMTDEFLSNKTVTRPHLICLSVFSALSKLVPSLISHTSILNRIVVSL